MVLSHLTAHLESACGLSDATVTPKRSARDAKRVKVLGKEDAPFEFASARLVTTPVFARALGRAALDFISAYSVSFDLRRCFCACLTQPR